VLLNNNENLTSSYSGHSKASRFLLSQKVAPLLPAADEGVKFIKSSHGN